jgi:hypothetical protein
VEKLGALPSGVLIKEEEDTPWYLVISIMKGGLS